MSCTDCPIPDLLGGANGTYTITSFDDFGCSTTKSITINFINEEFIFPNIVSESALTDENRYFYLKNRLNLKYDLDIYDRWGNLMFSKKAISSNDYNSAWRPYNVSLGVYVYKAVIYSGGIANPIVGTLSVI